MSNPLTVQRPRAHSATSHSDTDTHDSGYASRSASGGSAKSDAARIDPGLDTADSAIAAEPVREEIILHAERHKVWVSVRFAGWAEEFENSNWKFGSALCPDKPLSFCGVEGIARGIFEAEELALGREPRSGVAKIYMQTYGEPGNIPYTIQREIDALTRLQEVSNKITIRAPKMIEFKIVEQEQWSLVPGGWMVIIVMSRCPGQQLDLDQFYRFNIAKRKDIRRSFLEVMRGLYAVGIVPMDLGMQNLLWNEIEKQCYLVDLENAFVGEESAESCFLPKEALREFELIEWHWIDGSLWHCGKGDNEYPGIDVA